MRKSYLGLMIMVLGFSPVTYASSPRFDCPPGTFPQRVMMNGYMTTICQSYRPDAFYRPQIPQPFIQTPGFSITIPFYGRDHDDRWHRNDYRDHHHSHGHREHDHD